MTLTAEQSSNKARYEAAPTAEIIDIIRTAMGEGCIRPCHVFDAVDELICRIQVLENRPKRNCDVGTAEEQWSRFEKMCFSNRQPDDPDYCSCKCKVDGGCVNDCALIWAQMPYEAEEGGEK